MRYLEHEATYIIARFPTGDRVYITIYNLSNNEKLVDNEKMEEIESTGFYKYYFIPNVTLLTEVLYIVDNGAEEHAGKMIFGGYPDEAIDDLTQIKNKTDNLPSDPASTTDVTKSQDSILMQVGINQTLINELLDVEQGNWVIQNNQMIFYKRDGNELMRFNLFDSSGNPSETTVYRRDKV